MKSLVDTKLLRELIQGVFDTSPNPLTEIADALAKQDAIFMLDDSYEIAKIFNTPTHQVVMLKTFEEESSESGGEFDENDEEVFSVGYSTSHQVTQVMFHKGVRIQRSFGFEEEADRNECWASLTQQTAQEFVDATTKFIDENSN